MLNSLLEPEAEQCSRKPRLLSELTCDYYIVHLQKS
jgi:hypothetical protein